MGTPYQLDPPSQGVQEKLVKGGVTPANYDTWIKYAKFAVAGGVVTVGARALGAMFMGSDVPLAAIAEAGPALNLVALVEAAGAGSGGGVLLLTIIDVVISPVARTMLMPKNDNDSCGLH